MGKQKKMKAQRCKMKNGDLRGWKGKIRNDVDQHPSNDEDSDNDDSQFFNLATKALQKLNKSNVTFSNSHTGSATLPSAGGDTILAIANDISDHNSNAQKQFRSPKGRAPLQIVSSNPSSVRGSFLSREKMKRSDDSNPNQAAAIEETN